MAANKFATMLHRNTNRLTVVLVYAFLEWTLIALLLCNSLFSYLILKFADHFGLKRPCVLCSRLDRRDSIGDSICEAHAREVSSLEYCSSHQRLADSRDMCDDCSEEECCWSSKRFGFFPWTSRIGIVNGVVEDEEEEEEEKVKACSCCGVSLSNKRFYQPCIVIKPSSWGVLDYAQKKGLVENNNLHDDHDHDHDGQSQSQTDHSDRSSDQRIEENGETEERHVQIEAFEDKVSEVLEKDEVEEKSEIGVQHLDFYIGEEGCTLIPIDIGRKGTIGNEEEEEDVILDFEMDVKTQPAENWHNSGETMVFKPLLVSQGTQTVLEDSNIENEETHLDDDDDDVALVHQQGCDCDDDDDDDDDENDGEISIGTSIPDHEQLETSIPWEQQEEGKEDHFTSSINLHFHDNHVQDFGQEIVSPIQHYNHSTEEGSEISESFFEGEATAEKLKSALRAVYAELEEERSASAVAASHTMAMINRLQEEKAAVQMEAVQYRRLMEEQSEYDQEALRLLNDLLIRRERENLELKKDLEGYRVNDYDDDDHDGDYHDHEHDDYENTPVEAVLYFEEERLSILDQLRVLEEKLFALSDEDIVDPNQNQDQDQNQHFEGARMFGVKGRRLLPLFDAEAEECGGGGGGGGDDDVASRVAAEEEVDRVYERLQVLEADREFVRLCVGSLKKGDKGLRLLRDILDNLRRLRTVEHL